MTMHARHRSSSRSPRRQRGSVYIAVLGVAMLVTLLGISLTLAARLQRRVDTAAANAAQARFLAQSGLELGMQYMTINPAWRNSPPTKTDVVPIGGGSGCVWMVDPIDNNLGNNTSDPVIMYAQGTFGRGELAAKRQCSVRLEAVNGGPAMRPVAGTWQQQINQ